VVGATTEHGKVEYFPVATQKQSNSFVVFQHLLTASGVHQLRTDKESEKLK
jgi:hypothetical protein